MGDVDRWWCAWAAIGIFSSRVRMAACATKCCAVVCLPRAVEGCGNVRVPSPVRKEKTTSDVHQSCMCLVVRIDPIYRTCLYVIDGHI